MTEPNRPTPADQRVCAVIVTFNRLELLQAALAALRAQTRPVEGILVVDNGSTDDTPAWLAGEAARDPALRVVTQPNLGSSGGVHAGLSAAFAGDFDWFWIMDDDTIAEPAALAAMLAAATRFSTAHPGARLGWLNSVVLWTDGALHRMNEPKLEPYLRWDSHVLAQRYLPAQGCSFVSVMVSRVAVGECGLPLKDMFIWYDDVEFTGRIRLQGFSGLVVLDSFVEHRTKLNYAPDIEDLNETNLSRFRLAFRNEVLTMRTIQTGGPVAVFIRFIRLMARRVYLMVRARKFPWLILSLQQGLRGFTMERRIDFPPGASTAKPLSAP
jgi:GT2 family glycosyltransferase